MSTPPPATERGKNTVVILIVTATVVAAVVAGLQADANIRANDANRDSQFYAVQLAGELQRSGLQSNYDLALFARALQDLQESTVLQLAALQMESDNDLKGGTATRLRAAEAAARAAQEQAASVFYADARYAPDTPDDLPNMEQYLTDSQARSFELLGLQNAAADAYTRWNRKSDGYAADLTVLTIALFLLGLAQGLSPRLRWLFGAFGTLAIGVAVLWALAILVLG